MPASGVFGTNDWYDHYGDSHPDRIFETVEFDWSVPEGPWPFRD